MSLQERELHDQKSRNWLALGGGFIVLLIAALFFIYGLNPAAESDISSPPLAGETDNARQVVLPESGPPLQVGDLAYNFTLSDLEGNQVALNQFLGQPVIVNYWATWCGPCRIEMPHLQNTFAARQADGLAILALNQDETAAEAGQFFDEFGLTFTPLLDEGKATSENYGVGRILPTTFFINAAGEITAIHRGPLTQSQIDGYLADTIPAP